VPTDVPIYQYTGALDNGGETVELSRPGVVDPDGTVPWVVVDSVKYNNKAPWPVGADGTGRSIAKISPGLYTNDPANWQLGSLTAPPAAPMARKLRWSTWVRPSPW